MKKTAYVIRNQTYLTTPSALLQNSTQELLNVLSSPVEEIKRRELQRQRQEVKRIFEADRNVRKVDQDVHRKGFFPK